VTGSTKHLSKGRERERVRERAGDVLRLSPVLVDRTRNVVVGHHSSLK